MGVDRIKAAIRDAGVVGMGGAAFPTHVKLSPPKDRPIDTVILNGVECEPYLTCDYRIMLEHARGITNGLKIIMRALGVKKAIIGIEANKKDAFEKVRDAVWADENISVEMLDVKYPQGAEKQLIQALTGREVPPGRLPLDVGIVVQNVATAYAVFEAVAWSRPLLERAVTVTGDGVSRPANLGCAGWYFDPVSSHQTGNRSKNEKNNIGWPHDGPRCCKCRTSTCEGDERDSSA